jgi:hypothetical protein
MALTLREDEQPQIVPQPNMGVSPRTPPATAAYMAAPSVQSQPQITAQPNMGVSPSTSNDAAAAYLNPPAAPVDTTPRLPALPGRPPMSVSGQFSPRTADDATAAYMAAPQRPSVLSAVPGAMRAAAGALIDPMANVRGDVASEYQRGAAISPATGAGMAVREAVVSPVSRAMGAVTAATAPLRNAASSFMGNMGEGVRAFITGQPPAPATPLTAGRTAAVPSVGAARQPVTVDQQGNEVPPQQGNNSFQVGGLTVTDNGNLRTITGDAPAPVRVPAVGGAQPTLSAPAPVTSVADARPGAKGPLGGLMGSLTGLQLIRGANNEQQRGYNDQVKAINTGLNVAKVGGELQKTSAETEKLQQDNKNALQIQSLRSQLVSATDPKVKKDIENKLYALQGKKAGNFQVVQSESIDPATGQQVKTPYILDADSGEARPLIPPQGNGMSYVGKTPDGKRVFKDAQGKQHVEG